MSPKVAAAHREKYLQGRRDQILEAAIKVFKKDGFAGANVADIAALAGMSKGTIYLYFKSKEDIFNAIITERTFIPQLVDLLQDQQAPLESALKNLAERYYQFMDDYMPIFYLVVADSNRFPNHAEKVYREIILRSNEILANYLSRYSETGQIRPLDDPFLTARAFMGMLLIYFFTQELLGGKHITPIERTTWIDQAVQLFIEGLR